MSLVTLKIGNFRSLEVDNYEVKKRNFTSFSTLTLFSVILKIHTKSCVEYTANDR